VERGTRASVPFKRRAHRIPSWSMWRVETLCAFAVSAGVPACSTMQPHAVAGARPASELPAADGYVACSAPAGQLAYHGHALGAPSGTLSGSVHFSYLRVDDYWIPIASLDIFGTTKQQAVHLLKMGTHGHADYDHLVFFEPKGHVEMPIQTDVRFDVKWTPRAVQFRIDPDPTWTTVPMAFAPLAFGTSCSTADVVFHGVSLTPDAPTTAEMPPAS
jgi:hypothetical protein